MPKLDDEQLDELFELYRLGNKVFGPGFFPVDAGQNRFNNRDAFTALTDGAHQGSYDRMIEDVFEDLPSKDRNALAGELSRLYSKSKSNLSEGLSAAHPSYRYMERQIRRKVIADRIRDAYDQSGGDLQKTLERLEKSSPKRKPDIRGELKGGMPQFGLSADPSENAVKEKPHGIAAPRMRYAAFAGRHQRLLRRLGGKTPRYEWAARIRG